MSRPVRVMFFDHVAALGGGEVALLNLIRHLDPRRIEAVVVLGEDGPLADRLRAHADVHILPLRADIRRARKDGLQNRATLAIGTLTAASMYVVRLVRFIRQHRIQLVHTNSLKADVLGGCAARVSGTPLIWHVRDRIAPDYLPTGVVRIFRWLALWLPDLVIAASRAVAATLPIPATRIQVVHDGTPHEEFAANPATAESATQQVGLVGRLSPWKGQDVFMRAAAIVTRQFPQARFLIVGAALFEESAFEDRLRALRAELGLDDIVIFTGFRQDIHYAIAELDILVHASVRPEPFGQVIIEGMAAGKPVVATNGGGVTEIIDHSINGLLVEMGDAEGMAAAIAQLLSDPAMARAMGRRAQDHVARHFSITRTVNGVMDAYQRVLMQSLQLPSADSKTRWRHS